MLTSSGQAANFFAVFNICEAGDHLIASSAIYGGTYNLFGVTMKKMGIDCTFVDPEISEEDLQKNSNQTQNVSLEKPLQIQLYVFSILKNLRKLLMRMEFH